MGTAEKYVDIHTLLRRSKYMWVRSSHMYNINIIHNDLDLKLSPY